MPLYSFEGREPDVSPSAWIAPTATLVGDVTVEAEASIWYGAVLRADFGPIVVRQGANVQDGSVLHGGPDLSRLARFRPCVEARQIFCGSSSCESSFCRSRAISGRCISASIFIA